MGIYVSRVASNTNHGDVHVLKNYRYGNHDSDFNLSRYHILEREQSWPNALTRQDVFGKEAGVSNYYLPVYSADMADTTPKLLLWFFDSRGGNYYQELDSDGNEVPQPDWVDLSVVEWFTMTRNRLRTEYGQDLPSLAFFHIPTNASLAFQQGPGVRPHYEPGINDDNPLAQQGYAGGQGTVTGNAFTYSGQDVPFMQALLSTPNLMATFSGHDHGDDWCFRWDSRLPGMTLTGNGLDMCFGRHSGYGGYGTWTRASRREYPHPSHIIRRQDLTVNFRGSAHRRQSQEQSPGNMA